MAYLRKSAILVEELFGLVALEPLFDLLETLRVGLGVEDGDLVCAPEVFDLVAIDFFGAGPALGGAKDNHRPARAFDGL
jgi:hypothetical protein